MVGLPLIVALDQKFSLDQKAVMALDKAEKTAENLKATASNTKTKVVSAVFESKTAAENLIETHPRPFNQLLDVTEVIVNGLLPPSPQPAQAPAQHGVIERATTLGLDVSKRVQSVVLHISFRSPAEVRATSPVWSIWSSDYGLTFPSRRLPSWLMLLILFNTLRSISTLTSRRLVWRMPSKL